MDRTGTDLQCVFVAPMGAGDPGRIRGLCSTPSAGSSAPASPGWIRRGAIRRIKLLSSLSALANDRGVSIGCYRDSRKISAIAARSISVNPSSTRPSPRRKRGAAVGATRRGTGTKFMAIVDSDLPLAVHVASASPYGPHLVPGTRRTAQSKSVLTVIQGAHLGWNQRRNCGETECFTPLLE